MDQALVFDRKVVRERTNATSTSEIWHISVTLSFIAAIIFSYWIYNQIPETGLALIFITFVMSLICFVAGMLVLQVSISFVRSFYFSAQVKYLCLLEVRNAHFISVLKEIITTEKYTELKEVMDRSKKTYPDLFKASQIAEPTALKSYLLRKYAQNLELFFKKTEEFGIQPNPEVILESLFETMKDVDCDIASGETVDMICTISELHHTLCTQKIQIFKQFPMRRELSIKINKLQKEFVPTA